MVALRTISVVMKRVNPRLLVNSREPISRPFSLMFTAN